VGVEELTSDEKAALQREKRLAYGRAYRYVNRKSLSAKERIYRAANPEPVRARRRAYRTANRERLNAEHKAYREANPERIRMLNKAYYAANRERLMARQRAYYAANPEQVRAQNRASYAASPEQIRAQKKARRAQKAGAPINDLTRSQWEEIKGAYGYRCVYCGRKMQRLTQDHLTPISKKGSHTVPNVVPACGPCNSKKRAGAVPQPVQPLLLTLAPPMPKKMS
jgi:5-methylcytosine-specific restriction endonuclease McrA